VPYFVILREIEKNMVNIKKKRITMHQLDKLIALQYLVRNNPLCDNCVRADLEEIRIAAGLYHVVREILESGQEIYRQEEIDRKIKAATSF
jgi:hypothetical protein